MDRPVVYAKRFPASHAWLVRERIDKALAEIAELPDFMGDLWDGECVVIVKLSAATAKQRGVA
jgi:hypothetical protein